jgi:DNA polymerase IV
VTASVSYRRGKPESNDVDIVFTHPNKEKQKGLCKKLMKQLIERGTYILTLVGLPCH